MECYCDMNLMFIINFVVYFINLTIPLFIIHLLIEDY